MIDATLDTLGVALGIGIIAAPTLAARWAWRKARRTTTGRRLRARLSARRIRRAPR